MVGGIHVRSELADQEGSDGAVVEAILGRCWIVSSRCWDDAREGTGLVCFGVALVRGCLCT